MDDPAGDTMDAGSSTASTNSIPLCYRNLDHPLKSTSLSPSGHARRTKVLPSLAGRKRQRSEEAEEAVEEDSDDEVEDLLTANQGDETEDDLSGETEDEEGNEMDNGSSEIDPESTHTSHLSSTYIWANLAHRYDRRTWSESSTISGRSEATTDFAPHNAS